MHARRHTNTGDATPKVACDFGKEKFVLYSGKNMKKKPFAKHFILYI